MQNEDQAEWPNTFGYLLKSDGFPISEEATRRAYEIFNAVVEEARSHYFVCDGSNKDSTSSNESKRPSRPPEKTRLTTFYESRTRKAVEGLRTSRHSQSLATEVEAALAGLQARMIHPESKSTLKIWKYSLMIS